MNKPRFVPVSHNPLAALERLPGWWRGKANARFEFAIDAAKRGADKEMDEHLQKSAEYARKVKEIVTP